MTTMPQAAKYGADKSRSPGKNDFPRLPGYEGSTATDMRMGAFGADMTNFAPITSQYSGFNSTYNIGEKGDVPNYMQKVQQSSANNNNVMDKMKGYQATKMGEISLMNHNENFNATPAAASGFPQGVGQEFIEDIKTKMQRYENERRELDKIREQFAMGPTPKARSQDRGSAMYGSFQGNPMNAMMYPQQMSNMSPLMQQTRVVAAEPAKAPAMSSNKVE